LEPHSFILNQGFPVPCAAVKDNPLQSSGLQPAAREMGGIRAEKDSLARKIQVCFAIL
jgi:hypothetical protein